MKEQTGPLLEFCEHVLFYILQFFLFSLRNLNCSFADADVLPNIFQDLGGPMGMKPFDELGLQRIECHLTSDVCDARHEVLLLWWREGGGGVCITGVAAAVGSGW